MQYSLVGCVSLWFFNVFWVQKQFWQRSTLLHFKHLYLSIEHWIAKTLARRWISLCTYLNPTIGNALHLAHFASCLTVSAVARRWRVGNHTRQTGSFSIHVFSSSSFRVSVGWILDCVQDIVLTTRLLCHTVFSLYQFPTVFNSIINSFVLKSAALWNWICNLQTIVTHYSPWVTRASFTISRSWSKIFMLDCDIPTLFSGCTCWYMTNSRDATTIIN